MIKFQEKLPKKLTEQEYARRDPRTMHVRGRFGIAGWTQTQITVDEWKIALEKNRLYINIRKIEVVLVFWEMKQNNITIRTEIEQNNKPIRPAETRDE